MRILIITNHFFPENFRINDLALGLKERGHDISVLTGVPNYPEGKFFAGYGIFKKRVEHYKGIKVMRVPMIPRGKGKSWNLVLNYLSFAVMSCLFAPFYCRDKYDVIFVFETSPVTVGLPAIVVKWIQSTPIIFWVLDLWPESLSATGAIRSVKTLSLIRRLVRFIYSKCDKILVSSPGFVQSIEAVGGYSGGIGYFPNWVEPDYLIQNEAVSTYVLPEGFIVMFAGNIGVAQDFETILLAAENLIAYPDIHWVILGDGRRTDWVKAEVQKRGLLEQFHLLGRFPAETMPGFMASADALLMTLKREPIFALTVPGKMQTYLASGKPIIAGLDGEGAHLVKEAKAGLACPAESPDELSELVLEMYKMSPEERQRLGVNGLLYCKSNFDRDKLFDKLESLMEEFKQSTG